MNFYTPNKIDFNSLVNIANNDETIEAIWREFVNQSKKANVCIVDGSPILQDWNVDESKNVFACKWLTEEGLYEVEVDFDNLSEVQIMGPGHWVLFEQRNENSHIQHQLRTEVRFYELKPLVPDSLPEGFKEYFEGWEIPEEIGLVDVVYNDGTIDSCMRPDEITWTSFSVKGWKPSSEDDCCDALVGNGQLSDLIPDVSKLRQQEPFMIVEAKAVITGKEQDIILAIGDFNAQAWEEAALSDSLIYFWMDEQQFDWIQVCGLTENNRHLDDSNYLVNVSFDTLTKFA